MFEENVSDHLSIDETSLSQGELYTIVTSKKGKGKKGSLVAMIKGTESEKVSSVLKKIPEAQRRKVKEVTLDMAASMQKIVRHCFPKSQQVTDRFHVQKLAYDALQQLRINHRWEAIEQENNEIQLCREIGKDFKANKLENGDTLRQLLARSRYLLFKSEKKWTPSQRYRAEVLFKHYPDIEEAYMLCRELGGIYERTKHKGVALTALARWYERVERAGFKVFNTISRTIQYNYQTILNYFDNRSIGASVVKEVQYIGIVRIDGC